jgi:hypothetical protein
MTSSDLRPSSDLRRLSSERPSPGARAAGVLLVLLVQAAGLYLAFWAAFFSLALVTGCFISCSPATPTEVAGGLALGAAAAVLAAAGPLTAALLSRSRTWLHVAAGVAALAVLAMGVVDSRW